MFNKKMEKTFNEQINEELYSAYLYLSMVAYFESINLPGFANWMRVQTQEEVVHAMKFYDYINQRNGRVTLTALADPQIEWKSPMDAFEAAYKHEVHITAKINELVNLAIGEKDHAANMFLQWFVNEQVEEEKNPSDIIQKLKMIKDSSEGLYMLDKELATRVFTPPPANQQA
jgi:ferritin